MITAAGYSKDPSLIPEGIVVTFTKQMMLEQGGVINFFREFERIMNDSEGEFHFHLSKKPAQDKSLSHIYIIYAGRLYARVYYGGWQTKIIPGRKLNGTPSMIDRSRIVMCGPIEKPPIKIYIKGFRSFRYSTKLF